MQRLVKSTVALAALLLVASSGGPTARARASSTEVLAVTARVVSAAASAAPTVGAPTEHAEGPPIAWAEALAPLRFVRSHGGGALEVQLYRHDGTIDEEAAARLDGLLDDAAAEAGAPRAIDRRLLQLVVKAAAHFHANQVVVVSSWREAKRPGSRHATGEAMDFILGGVASGTLAQYLRTAGRVGVGIYTHPRTRFVHLDVRDESFHWIDSSPPGRTWREKGITDRGAAARDRAYSPDQDLPG